MDFRSWFFAYITPPEWSALAGVGTLVIAFAAAVFAFFQVRVASQSRRDQTRPYVAVYLEATHLTIYFTVKNFGSTTARDVRVTLDKPMRRSFKIGDEYEVFNHFEILPVMVPGQEWRTFFDSALGRFADEKLKMETYMATVTYSDSRGRRLPPDRFALDWTTFHDLEFESKEDISDIAKSVAKIQGAVETWSDSGGGLSVYTRDGEAKDERQKVAREERRERFAEHQRVLREQLAQQTQSTEPAHSASVDQATEPATDR